MKMVVSSFLLIVASFGAFAAHAAPKPVLPPELGRYVGKDEDGGNCQVIVDTNHMSSYYPGDTTRFVALLLEDNLQLELFFSSLVNGKGEMEPNSVFSTDEYEEGRLIMMYSHLAPDAGFRFSENIFPVRRTYSTTAELDLNGRKEMSVTMERNYSADRPVTYVCRGLRKL